MRKQSKPSFLIGVAEALAAIETAWSLQNAGFRVIAFRRAGSRPALRYVRGVQTYEVPPPEIDAAATVAAVRAMLSALTPTTFLPLDDHAVWVCDRLADVPVPLAGPAGFAAECALDKSIQVEIATRAGLPVPPTQVVDSLDDVGRVDFPVMIKPGRALYEVRGALVRPTGVVCANNDELRTATKRSWPGPVLVQPLIRGTGEGLFGHADGNGVVGWSAHRRVRMVNPQGSASSACRSAPIDERLVEAGRRLLSAVSWRGLFMLEFLRDADGEPWFMELNGRTWGSMALARRRGFEYPAWTVQSILNPGFKPSLPSRPPEIVCRNIGLELAHLMFVARGAQSDAEMEWPRLSSAIRDVFRFSARDRLYNWNRTQPDVLVADALSTVKRYVFKAMGRRQ
jgi:biotin carboxylase